MAHQSFTGDGLNTLSFTRPKGNCFSLGTARFLCPMRHLLQVLGAEHLSVSKAIKKRTAGWEMVSATVTLPPPTAESKRLKITERGKQEVWSHSLFKEVIPRECSFELGGGQGRLQAWGTRNAAEPSRAGPLASSPGTLGFREAAGWPVEAPSGVSVPYGYLPQLWERSLHSKRAEKPH